MSAFDNFFANAFPGTPENTSNEVPAYQFMSPPVINNASGVVANNGAASFLSNLGQAFTNALPQVLNNVPVWISNSLHQPNPGAAANYTLPYKGQPGNQTVLGATTGQVATSTGISKNMLIIGGAAAAVILLIILSRK